MTRLVFIHGSVTNADLSWGRQRALAGRFEVFAPNRPGFPPGPPIERVDFEPTSWSYFASYSGVVKIFDGKGSNVRPEREDEQYARRIGEGLLRSIPELKKERQ